MAGTCGTCTACCKVFAIAELAKPIGEWCKHCAIGQGCKIYASRPAPCVDFKCLWLQSQEKESPFEPLPLEMRPDKCKVVISPTTNPQVICAITMNGSSDAWRKLPVRPVLRALVKAGFAVVCGSAGSTRRTLLEMNKDNVYVVSEAKLTAPDENGMQWSVR